MTTVTNVQNHIPSPTATKMHTDATAKQTEIKPQEENKIRCDSYVPEDEIAKTPIGLYDTTRDENGNRQILFESPEKANDVKNNGSQHKDASDQATPCTANTDKVDREIEKLKEKEKQLTQQLQRTTDPQKSDAIARQLRQVENELRQKDNDTYRRQNTYFS